MPQNVSKNLYTNKDVNYFRNAISKLYDAVSAPVSYTRDALAEELQSVRDTAYFLYQETKEKVGYEQTLKDRVGTKQKKNKLKSSSSKMIKSNMIDFKDKMFVRRNMRKRIQGDQKFKCFQHNYDYGELHTTLWDKDNGNLFVQIKNPLG